MKNRNLKYSVAGGLIAAVLVLFSLQFQSCRSGRNEVSFNEDIRPILAKNCTNCHGGVKRESGLSLLFREDALTELESGRRAIVPGQPNKSELVRRVKDPDPEMRMPPEADPLSSEEIRLLTRWIAEGAKWETHWAYVVPEAPVSPPLKSAWMKHELDGFVWQKLQQEGLHPQPPAEQATLIRRASLDLTGLPPTPEQVAEFLSDQSPEAYETLLDSLLASPHYGEKWASMWLDLARYADSKGYEKDHHREIWKYRDWVIEAFNRDLPFDQFTIEQLAGDLLPNPSEEQLIATGFHRNTMNNSEGGVQNEEFRMAAVIDRVNTTWEVWNSTSFGCAQCHNHPYDPFRQKEYYEYLAFFNNTKDEDTGDDAPVLKFYPAETNAKIDLIRDWIKENSSAVAGEGNGRAEQIDELLHVTEPKFWSYRAEVISKTAKNGDDYLLEGRAGGLAVLPDFPLNGTTHFLVHYRSVYPDSYLEIHLDDPEGRLLGSWQLGEPLGMRYAIFKLKAIEGRHDLYIRFKSPTASGAKNDQVGHLLWILPSPALSVFERDGGEYPKAIFLEILSSKAQSTPILLENPPGFTRTTHILERGSWTNPKEEVEAAIPGSLPGWDESLPRNRLGLARWLVSKDHPLTARVIVNRIWEQLFGTGLVETLEDLGTQGERPSHPELLNYLALQLIRNHQWSLKGLLKEIMLSATYRQSSKASATLLEKDPNNRLFSRGPRFRLSAEQIRDQALAVSGLLSPKIGGPSVMPHLPEGVWNVVYQQYTTVQWKLSAGEDRYRRGLYTYWKRSLPYPSMITFDSQSRDVCVSRRIRTNTPLQALVTLNDPVYVEAANALGRLMHQQEGSTPEEQIQYGYQRAIGRSPTDAVLASLGRLYRDAEAAFKAKTAIAGKTGYYEKVELEGPMALVANAILNLDAFIVKD